MTNSQLQSTSYIQAKNLERTSKALSILETAQRELKNIETFAAFELVCTFGIKLLKKEGLV